MPKQIKTIISIVTLAVAAAVGATWWFSMRADSSRGGELPVHMGDADRVSRLAYIWPQSGEVLSYIVESETTGSADLAAIEQSEPGGKSENPSGGSLSSVSASSRFVFQLRFVSKPSDGFNVVAKASSTNVTVNGSNVADASHYLRPFAFSLTRTGRMSNFEFTEGVSMAARSSLQSSIEALQFVIDPSSSLASTTSRHDRWTVLESDLRGVSACEYRADVAAVLMKDAASVKDARLVVRKRIGYESISSNVGGAEGTKIIVTESRGEALVHATRPWIDQIEARESYSYDVRGGIVGRASVRVTVTRANPNASELPSTIDEFQAILKSRELVIESLDRTNPTLDPVTKELTCDDLVKMVASNKGSATRKGYEAAVNWLRQDGARCKELVEWLAANGESLEIVVADQLWGALAEAGTAAAIAAYAEVIRSSESSDWMLIKAVGHSHGIMNPSRELIDALWTCWQGRTAHEGLRAVAGGSSILAIGSLGSASKLNEPLKAAIANELDGELRRSTVATDRERVLVAIGNHGGDVLLPTLERELSDQSTNHRAEAYRAARHMPSDAVDESLLSRIDQEESIGVRAVAYESLKDQVTFARLAWARGRLAVEEHEVPLIALVKLIGAGMEKFPSDESNRDALNALLSRQPPAKVRAEIYRFTMASGR